MKFAITHCYTDKNKGDAAIIIATTQLIRSIDPDAEINFYSTYGPHDKRLLTDHKIIKQYADKIYPGLVYQPEPMRFFASHDKSRGLSFIIIFLKAVLLLLSTNTFFIKWFLTDCEIEGINEILDSDIIISKGGSYLTAQNKSLRQTLSLATMLYPFVFASRYKKKIVIFSQSLGPVVGKFNKFIFKKSLENVDAIHLRESLCIRKYSEVRAVCENNKAVSVVPDTAFALKHDETDIPLPININKRFFNVGYTLVDHPFIYLNSVTEIQKKRENYKKCIVDSIIYLIENKNAIIHIFPQVLVGDSRLGSSDVQLSKYIVQLFSNGIYSDRVKFYDDNFTPIELRQMYSQMDIFIGTRLHSVIFALSMCVPSINISYHGTKSQGILENLGNFDKYVIDINHLVSEDFINMIDEMCHNRKDISFKLSKSIKIARNDLNNAMQKVIKQQFTKH